MIYPLGKLSKPQVSPWGLYTARGHEASCTKKPVIWYEFDQDLLVTFSGQDKSKMVTICFAHISFFNLVKGLTSKTQGNVLSFGGYY